MGSWQQHKNNLPPEPPYDPPQHDAHLPFGCTTSSDPAMNSSNPFMPSSADTVVDMPRDIGFPHDGDLATMPGQQPLFSEADQRLIGGFFQSISSDPGQEINFGEGLIFSDQWESQFQQPPPTVIGHQIHSSNTPMDSILSSLTFDPSFIPTFPPPAHVISPEVLGAAQALSRTNGPPHNQFHGMPGQIQTTMGPPVGSVPSSQYPPHYTNGQRHNPMMNHQVISNGYTDMYNSVAPALPTNHARPFSHPEIHFGTDRSFTGGNFNPAEANVEGKIFEQQDSILGCLQPNTSAAPTRASSPQPNGMPTFEVKSPLKLRTAQERIVPIQSEPDKPVEPAKKRRKSKPKATPDADETPAFSPDAPTTTPGRMASGSIGSIPESAVVNESSPVEEPPSAGGKRRRGAGAAKKPPRQNLSEEQKRENHIRSEQKRRHQIKDAFHDVQEIVPDIRGQGLSKSVILLTTVSYLEGLLKGNEELEEKLRMAGYTPPS